jgi:hypothetical protein
MNKTGTNYKLPRVPRQGIGVYLLIPEACQEIQEFNHGPHEKHELFARYL